MQYGELMGANMHNSTNKEMRWKDAVRKVGLMTIVILLLVSTLFVFAGCNYEAKSYRKDETFFETELFACILVGPKKNKVQICELTQLGLEQEELVIPKEINGYKVSDFGYGGFSSLNLHTAQPKKVFLPYGLTIHRSSHLFWGPEETIIILNFSYNPTYYKYEFVQDVYFSDDKKGELTRSKNKHVANVRFYMNLPETDAKFYSTPRIHWIDNLNVGERIKTIPPIPNREGYIFSGWYMEEACTTAFNFDLEKGEDDMELYAKWEKLNG